MQKCGIVGTGSIAKWHYEAIEATGKGMVTGACSRNREKLAVFCEAYQIKAYSSYEEMLSDQSIDVICICTPSGLHSEMIIKASNAGKNIVVEKPMAITKKQCDEVIKALEKNRTLLSVAYQSRFSDSFVAVKKAINDGVLGKIMFADVYMKFYRSEEYYSTSSWKGTMTMDGGGALMNQGSHGVDIMLFLMGEADSVYANARTLKHKIEAEDTVAAVVEYKQGAIGVIQASTGIYPGLPRKIMIHGEKGSVVIEEDVITMFETVNRSIPEGIIIGRNDDFSASDPTAFSIDGHVAIYRNAFDSFLHKKIPLVNQYEARKSVSLIEAIYESSLKKKLVMVSE
ncbi:MAG: Gfo/Idh/MocA family oxidoreductase [Clostridia bacterium]|nr:Gfo/Idh/MocA family oxidoreductase [Clostridia bacterium]